MQHWNRASLALLTGFGTGEVTFNYARKYCSWLQMPEQDSKRLMDVFHGKVSF